MTQITIKKKKQIHTILRFAIQVMFFVLFPAAFSTAFTGIKGIFNAMSAGEVIEITSFVKVLIALLIYTFIFGRFFCGYACAFGTLSDILRSTYLWMCKKIKKKPIGIPETIENEMKYIKYLILLIIVLLCFFGVYGSLSGTSPWDVFSRLRLGKIEMTGYEVGAIVLFVIMVGMMISDRFFCRFLCPMGAAFALIPQIPIFAVKRDKSACLNGCKACMKTCPAKLDISNKHTWDMMGECIQCGKCSNTCPRTNVGVLNTKNYSHGIFMIILRTFILVAIFWILGI